MSASSEPDDPVVVVIDARDPAHATVAAGVVAAAAIAAAGGRAALWLGGRDEPELAEFKDEICPRHQAAARAGPGPKAGPAR